MKCSPEKKGQDGRPGVMNYHNFKESLAISHAAEDLPIWKEIYQKAFPNMVTMVNHRQDGDHQRAGIDRSIILDNSKQILIDEKVRGKNKKTGKIYRDILLEYWSNYERKIKGWVCKPLLADYIAYAIAPLGICYLLPVLQLQQAWKIQGEYWIENYRIIKAENNSIYDNRIYTTISVGVPVNELFKMIGSCLRISFNSFQLDLFEEE